MLGILQPGFTMQSGETHHLKRYERYPSLLAVCVTEEQDIEGERLFKMLVERLHEMLDAVDRADIVILTAPLYDDCQPAIVTKTMEAIAAQKKSILKKRFFPIINCGFPESEQITAVAIAIYHKFAISVGFKWAGSLDDRPYSQ